MAKMLQEQEEVTEGNKGAGEHGPGSNKHPGKQLREPLDSRLRML